jgi:CrcB protein
VGAYSTFSTFEWEIFSNVETRAFLISGLYLVLSVVLGLVAVWFGAWLGRAFS